MRSAIINRSSIESTMLTRSHSEWFETFKDWCQFIGNMRQVLNGVYPDLETMTWRQVAMKNSMGEVESYLRCLRNEHMSVNIEIMRDQVIEQKCWVWVRADYPHHYGKAIYREKKKFRKGPYNLRYLRPRHMR